MENIDKAFIGLRKVEIGCIAFVDHDQSSCAVEIELFTGLDGCTKGGNGCSPVLWIRTEDKGLLRSCYDGGKQRN